MIATMCRGVAGLVVAVLALAATAPAQAGPFYQLAGSIPLAGKSPEWDYLTLDPSHERLFVGRRSAGVTVLDLRSRQVAGRIDRSEDANAVTLIPDLDRGYTTNEDGTSTAFRLSTLKTLDRIKVGESADAAFYDPVSRQLVFTQGDNHQLAFLDVASGRLVGHLHMDSSKLEGGAADLAGRMFVAERDRNLVAVVDVKSHRLLEEWKTPGCTEPTSVAYDLADHRLMVGCRGAAPVIAVFNTDLGTIVAVLPIGRGVDGVVYSTKTHEVFATNGVDANLVVYHQDDRDHYALQQAVTTRPYARTMAYDERDGTVYTATAQGAFDPGLKARANVPAFYPNIYFDDTFAVLIYKPNR